MSHGGVYWVWDLERWTAWFLTPHSGLQGTPPDPHTVRACVLLVNWGAYRCLHLALCLSLHLCTPHWTGAYANAPSLRWGKVYTQSLPVLIGNLSLHAASPREGWQALSGCAHSATRPKTLSPLVALFGAIRRNAMLMLEFFCLALCTNSIISLVSNCDNGGQRSCDPHTSWVEHSQ